MAARFEWVPGTVPTGWKRGDNLRLINPKFKGGPIAALMRECSVLAPASILPEIVAVQFHASECSKVDLWLKSFANPDNYVTIYEQLTK